MEGLIEQVAGSEVILHKKYQYALTATRHIKFRKDPLFGEHYQKVSALIRKSCMPHVLTPEIIEIGIQGGYGFVVTERIVQTRSTTLDDLEMILEVLETTSVLESAKLPFLGNVLENPIYWRGSLLMEERFQEFLQKLNAISYDSEYFRKIYGKIKNPLSYKLTHGDLCHRNVIVGPCDTLYLVDLDTVGYYPSHFERVYMSSYLGIPVNLSKIQEELVQVETAIISSMGVNDSTVNIKNVINSVKKRLSLIEEGKTAGLQNILIGMGMALPTDRN